MSSQPPFSTSLPLGLHNPSPPNFASFKSSTDFGGPQTPADQVVGRPRTLTERMGLGPRVIPFKPPSTPLAGAQTFIGVETPSTFDTEMLDTSVDGGKQAQTRPLPRSSADIQPLSSAAEPSLQENPPPPDIWEHAKLVQNEWASVERPSPSPMIHQAMGAVTLGYHTSTGAQILQNKTQILMPYPKNDHALLPNGLAHPTTPPPLVHLSRGSEKIKKEEEEVKIKHEGEAKIKHSEEVETKRKGFEASLKRSGPSSFAPLEAHQLKSASRSRWTVEVSVKKEESSDQYIKAAVPELRSPASTVNVSQETSHVGKQIEARAVDFPQAASTVKSGQAIRENGTSILAHSDVGATSPSRREVDIEGAASNGWGKSLIAEMNARETAAAKPTSPRVQHTPLQHLSIKEPTSPVRASPQLGQAVNQQNDEPTRAYQGNMHRESPLIQANDTQLKISTGYIAPLGTGRNSTFDSPRDASGDRGREFTRRSASTLPTCPSGLTGTHRRYSPRRGSSPRCFDRHAQGQSIDHAPPRRHSPHTPPRARPLSASPRSRLPHRTSDIHDRQNGRTVDSYRPSRSRSRSPRRRWAERESAHATLVPRGPLYGDVNRGSTYPTHSTRPQSEWRTTVNNSSEPFRRNFDGSYPTRFQAGTCDSYRPTQPMTSGQPTREGYDSYRPRRGSPDSDQRSPMSMEWQESDGGNAKRAVSNPETFHRSSFIEKDVPISLLEEGHQGLKRRRAEEEPHTGPTKQNPTIPPEPSVKRRRIGDKDIEIGVSPADPGNPSRVPETNPPTYTSITANVPVTKLPIPEEYPSPPSSVSIGNQNKLLMRMAGNNYGPRPSQLVSSAREPTALHLTPTSSDDPDEAFRLQNKHGAHASPLATRDATDNTNLPIITRLSLKDRIHRNQPQNKPQPSHNDLLLSFTSDKPTENSGKPPPRRSSGSKPTPTERATVPETQQSALLGRIGPDQTSADQSGDHAVEVPELRGPQPPRLGVPGGNEQDASHSLHARVGLRADDTTLQRSRQVSNGGRGASSRIPPGGNLADRLA